MDSSSLTVEAKHAIDTYLNNRVVKAFAFLGIANIIALLGIYFTVSETVAEKSASKAIAATEKKIEGSTKQIDILSTKTIEGLTNALQYVGEAKSKAEGINRDIRNLQDLPLEKVGKVVDLLSKSTDEIKTLINVTDSINEATQKIDDAVPQVADNKTNILSIKSRLNLLEQGLYNYAKTDDLNKMIKDTVSFSDVENVKTLKLNEVLIEFGQSVTPDEGSGNDETIVHFKNAFVSPPNVVATTYSNDKSKSGYPVIFYITNNMFKVQVKDQTGSSKTRYKYNTIFNYIAIGKAK